MRVLTNTPSAIGRATSAFASGPRATDQDREKVRAMFGAIGLVVKVEDEQIDAVTALAGSGPAFVYARSIRIDDNERKISGGID
ncbi:MAG: hypothetical protein DMF13_05995 [Verrucomicrobia bacterium]|nr:MAG: hypothetical protein DMF13_05995 [Verrucomicrobiota bacterium]